MQALVPQGVIGYSQTRGNFCTECLLYRDSRGAFMVAPVGYGCLWRSGLEDDHAPAIRFLTRVCRRQMANANFRILQETPGRILLTWLCWILLDFAGFGDYSQAAGR